MQGGGGEGGNPYWGRVVYRRGDKHYFLFVMDRFSSNKVLYSGSNNFTNNFIPCFIGAILAKMEQRKNVKRGGLEKKKRGLKPSAHYVPFCFPVLLSGRKKLEVIVMTHELDRVILGFEFRFSE